MLFLDVVWIFRLFRRSWQASREDQQRQEEGEREWKVQRHRLRRSILLEEEWGVDASLPKETVETIDLLRKAHRSLMHEQFLLMVPCILVIFLTVLVASVHTIWLVWFLVIVCVTTLL